MKKKIGDLTAKEKFNICTKLDCDCEDCPFDCSFDNEHYMSKGYACKLNEKRYQYEEIEAEDNE